MPLLGVGRRALIGPIHHSHTAASFLVRLCRERLRGCAASQCRRVIPCSTVQDRAGARTLVLALAGSDPPGGARQASIPPLGARSDQAAMHSWEMWMDP